MADITNIASIQGRPGTLKNVWVDDAGPRTHEGRPLGVWRAEFDSVPLRAEWDSISRVAQHFHEMREMPVRPDADVWRQDGRKARVELDKAQEAIKRARLEAKATRLNLKPFDFSKGDNIIKASHRQWLREALAKMPEAERIKLVMADGMTEAKAAAMESKALSRIAGIPETIFDQVLDQAQREFFPEQMTRTDLVLQATETLQEAWNTADLSVRNVFTTLGEGPVPIEPKPMKPWAVGSQRRSESNEGGEDTSPIEQFNAAVALLEANKR
jgi:hypothetical protein